VRVECCGGRTTLARFGDLNLSRAKKENEFLPLPTGPSCWAINGIM